MEKTKYNQMIHSQEQAHMNAWKFITSSWHTSTWTSIPEGTRNTLNLPASLGMYNGNLVTRAGSETQQIAVKWLNRDRKIQ